MRLSLLEQREPILKVIAASLNRHFNEQLKVNLEKTENKNTIIFYGNKYLNFFATINTSNRNFEVIKKEYTHTPKAWKRLIQKIYVKLATTPFFYKRFHHYKLYFSGKRAKEYEKLLFMGGNTRLRIIDGLNDKTEVVLKMGYPDSFLRKEIDFRSALPFSKNIPKFYSSSKYALVEALHPGIPINRLSVREFLHYRIDAHKILLEQIVLPSMIQEKDYFTTLLQDIVDKLDTLGLTLDQPLLENIRTVFKDKVIPVSTSHGDFQDANLIISSDGLKIIDWETVDRRSIFYDRITLLANTRHGFRIEKVSEICDQIESAHGLTSSQIQLLYLLEELAYYFAYLPLYQKKKTTMQSKIDSLFKHLKNTASNIG